MVKYRRKLITFACTKLCTVKDYPHIMSPLSLASTVVRHHRRGGGGNGPLLVAGAENSVKEGRPSRWTEGLEAMFERISHQTGTPHMMNNIGEGDGGKHPFPSKSPLRAPLTLVALKNSRRWGKGSIQTQILRKVWKENRKIILSKRQRQCFPKQDV